MLDNSSSSIFSTVKISWLIVILSLGGFMIWAMMSTLDSAVIAPGKFEVLGSVKKISHLEGGIIKNIYVTEGQLVKKGQILISLSPIQAQAEFNQLSLNLFTNELAKKRIQAQLQDKSFTVQANSAHKVKKAIFDSELKAYHQQKNQLKTQQLLLQNKLKHLKKEVHSLTKQASLINEHIKVQQEDYQSLKTLAQKRYATQKQLSQAKQNLLDKQAEHSALQSQTAVTQQRIVDTNLKLSQLHQHFREQWVTQLQDVEQNIGRLQEQIKQMKDIVQRSELFAPVNGRIFNLAKHTVGGVVAPGEVLMNIVPTQDKLIVLAEVAANDIDRIAVNQVSRVRVSAYKSRHTPALLASIQTIGANVHQNEYTGEYYYPVRLVITAESAKQFKGYKMVPGMPVDVTIITAQRSPLEYFLIPIRDSLHHAFREE